MQAALPKCTNVNLNQGELGRTLLHYAAIGGHVEIVKLLLEDPRVDVRAVDREKFSALQLAADLGHVEVVKLLLGDPRVDANAKSNRGTTPLHLATAENHHKVVQLLLDSPRLITVNWADKSSPVRTALVTESKDALEELLNHSKVCLGTSEETWKSLEKVARWVLIKHCLVIKLIYQTYLRLLPQRLQAELQNKTF